MKSKMILVIAIALLIVMVVPVSAAGLKVIPTIAIVNVVKDQSVTIQTANFPANTTFNVTMGLIGTQGIGGTLVSKLTTGAGGTMLAKFYIPASLQGQYQIAIRLESTSSNHYSYDWFYNNTANYAPVYPVQPYPYAPTSTPKPAVFPEGSPGFNFLSVVKGESVQIGLFNYPANRDYAVFMGATKTSSPVYPWYEVAGFNSADGGSFTATWNIPAQLKFQPRITVKIYDMKYKIFTYNFFYNEDYP